MKEATPGAHLRRVEIMILPYARSAAKFDRALKLAVDGAHTRHGEAVRRRGREAVDERRRAGRRRQVEVPPQRHAAVDGLVRAEVAPRRPAAGAGRARGLRRCVLCGSPRTNSTPDQWAQPLRQKDEDKN